MSPREPAYRAAGQRPQRDVSANALSVARLLDRLCRAPGQYAVVVTVPAHRRAPWQVDFYRLDALRRGHTTPGR